MKNLNQAAEKQALRELNLDEIEVVSGGAQWSCTVKHTSTGGNEVSCTISGSF